MTALEKKKYNRLVWFVPLLAIVCSPIANAVGDMLLILIVYGTDAYFKQGLRIVKHKPFTLSTGVVLSVDIGGLGWFFDAVIWISLVCLGMYIVVGLYALIRRLTTAPH